MDRTSIEVREELSERAWEAIDSLVRTLGSSLNAREIAKRSLLTVTGQLLMRKAAFYVLDEENGHLVLLECLGIRRERLGSSVFEVNPRTRGFLATNESVRTVDEGFALPAEIQGHFEYAARIADGEKPLGLLLIGGKLGQDEFTEIDHRLLRTMGMVMGTILQRSLAHQQLLEAKQRTEHVQRLQQQILDHVSHEFNTPLMVLKSAAEFIFGADPQERDQFYDLHTQALARLEELVRSIIDVGAAPSEHRELIGMSHRDLVDQVILPLVEASSWREGEVLQRHVIDDEVTVRVDARPLRKALDALLRNAWQFSKPTSARLALRSAVVSRERWLLSEHQERIEAFVRRESPWPGAGNAVEPTDTKTAPEEGAGKDLCLLIELIDCGIGIPAPELATIFEPFAQASNSPYRHVSGSGMGLPACRKWLETMDGQVCAVSSENEGSIFAIFIPLAIAP